MKPKLQQAAKRGILRGPGLIPPEVTPNQMQAFKNYYRQAADKLNLVNTVMLESTQDAYRRTVSDIVNRVNVTQRILNNTTGEVVTGVSTWNEAVRHAVDQMVDNGLTGFIDHGGHKWRPETYAAMDIKSTLFNTAREAVFERNQEYGNDLYQVSSHNGARPLCYPWQGKVISASGWTGEVEDIDGEKVHVYAQSETSYGEPAGLFGINCGHYPMPFIPGFSSLKGTPQEPEENEKTYEQSQQQRKLERDLRQKRLDVEVLKAQGASDEEIKAAKAKADAASDKIDDFCAATGRTRRRNREWTPVQVSWEDAKTPPYGMPVANMTESYRKSAAPGTGSFTMETGYTARNHSIEIDVAKALHQTYGGDIRLNKESTTPGTYTADYTWRGKQWEQKSISTVKAADNATRHGIKQIASNPGGLVIQCGASVPYNEALPVILHRFRDNSNIDQMDIILTESSGRMHVYRVSK